MVTSPAHSDDDNVVLNENGDAPADGFDLPSKQATHTEEIAQVVTEAVSTGHSAHSDDDVVIVNENGDNVAEGFDLPKK